MLKYIVKRILNAIPLLILITLIGYSIINAAPGDPVNMFINPEKATKIDVERIREAYGLNKPVYVRYFLWLGNLLKGNLGDSYFHSRPVLDMLKEAIPNTLILGIASTILAVAVAIPAGIISAIKRNSFWDYVFSTISFIGVSLPSFWFGLMLILMFSLKLGWLPTSGMRENFEQFVFMDRLKHLILPAIVLGMGNMAQYMRFMRGAMLEVIRQDYVRTARSKGLSERIVIFKHTLRNALLPMVTLFGFLLPVLFGGAAITETIFSWPGIGRIMIEASFTRDYPVMMGDMLMIGSLVILGNLLADVLYAVADPRIKYD
ncbi:MAG: diguanylate cyclase [Clostridia bacterium BRH_c25]|nr:MAG: diguanylate cyclase [Clostridia bacterium BRH_c25]